MHGAKNKDFVFSQTSRTAFVFTQSEVPEPPWAAKG